MAYVSLAHPRLKYVSAAWDPYLVKDIGCVYFSDWTKQTGPD